MSLPVNVSHIDISFDFEFKCMQPVFEDHAIVFWPLGPSFLSFSNFLHRLFIRQLLSSAALFVFDFRVCSSLDNKLDDF